MVVGLAAPSAAATSIILAVTPEVLPVKIVPIIVVGSDGGA